MLKCSQTSSLFIFPSLFDSRVLLGREENQDQQGHLVSRCCVLTVC